MMRVVRLDSETDFAGWRRAARELRLEGLPPEDVSWGIGSDLFSTMMHGAANLDLLPLREKVAAQRPDEGSKVLSGVDRGSRDRMALRDPSPPASPDPLPQGERVEFSVPRAFLDLAEDVSLHRSPDRWSLLYRLLWRLRDQPRLIEIVSDPDVAAARDMAHQVAKASHKMKAFVRFRLVEGAPEETYVAWFEPAHRVTEKTAPHFVRRFANMAFSILTPDVCAHWDRETLAFTPGVDRAHAPAEDEQEEFWRTYYASIFNPARLKVDAMVREMPKRYWRNLPEAALIPSLIEQAGARTEAMVEAAPTQPRKRTAAGAAARALAQDQATVAPGQTPTPGSLKEIAELIQGCRRCDLWRCATQGVPGAGPAQAPMMLVGEQPGDQEDLAGKPFVGPAGQMLDRALADAGIERGEAYVTNAVKHFKHELRGKRRLHKTPDRGEVVACRWWLENERRLVRPRVIVALGATAVLSVFGKPLPIGKSRRQAFQLDDQAQGVVTYHPSFLLRLPDEAAKRKAYGELVADLAFAHERLKAA